MEFPIRGLCLAAFCFLTLTCAAQINDDFNDDADNSWVRYAPLDGLGAGGTGTWTLTDGTYRLQAAPATAPSSTGPARVGSYRTNIFAEFEMAADFIAWDASLDQLFGLLSRVNTPGLGTTAGYALSYATRAGRGTPGRFELYRITAEAGTALATVNYTLEAGHIYRFFLSGKLTALHGEVVDLGNPSVVIASLNATDSAYSRGYVGVFGYDNSQTANHAVDFSVDNFSAAPPAAMLLSSVDRSNGTIILTWPNWATTYQLQVSTDLTHPVWTPVTWNTTDNGTNLVFNDLMSDQQFFRLRHP